MNMKTFNEEMLLNEELLLEKCYDTLDNMKSILDWLAIESVSFFTFQVACDYKVEPETIEKIIEEHKEEFEREYIVIKGEKLDGFKDAAKEKNQRVYNLIKDKNEMMILSKKAVLRIGLLINNSDVAMWVRTIVLDILVDSNLGLIVDYVFKGKDLMELFIDTIEARQSKEVNATL